MDVRVVDREAARVPRPPALGPRSGRCGPRRSSRSTSDRRARSCHPGEAAVGDVVPARMLEVVGEQVAQVARLHRPAHPRGGALSTSPAASTSLPPGASAARPAPRRRARSVSARSRCSPSRISVSAMSKPDSARGPVPIETQKHVPPGSKQLTATTNAPSRRGRSRGRRKARRGRRDPGSRSRARTRAHAHEREPSVVRRLLGDLEVAVAVATRLPEPSGPGRGGASTSGARPRTPKRASSSGARAGACPPPAGRSAPPAARRHPQAPRRRSPRLEQSDRPPCSRAAATTRSGCREPQVGRPVAPARASPPGTTLASAANPTSVSRPIRGAACPQVVRPP